MESLMKTLTCPIPETISPLSPNGYLFSLARIPTATYFCQEVNLPDVTLGTTISATRFSDYPVPGDKMEFGQLNVQFLVDERMHNYKEIFNWLQGLGFPESNKQFANQIEAAPIGDISNSQKVVSDATLVILGNTNNPIQTVQFIDCFPEALSSLTFVSTAQDVQYLIGNATFRYSYYKFV